MRPLWYRNAVIHQIDPSLFLDVNGDGCGDLRGVIERLDYVRGLGATAIWLMPFHQSLFRDAGYDVSDHLQVDPRFGDLADVVYLLEKAEELGLHVIIELVVQHTSIEHRWFQEARRDPQSPYRDYYLWADEPDDSIEPIFATVEKSVWTRDEDAGQYYRHLFYHHEPDLNPGNPKVIEEIERIIAFWLRLGVSGFRVDAASHLIEQAGHGDRADGYWLLEHMRDFVTLRRPEAVLLGEVDVESEEYRDYFGEGDRLAVLLNFWANNHFFLSLARSEAETLQRALERQPEPPERAQYAIWLRNHDELDLERLSDDEREEVMQAFAPDPDMRAYNRGIRRRLAPMLDGNERRIAMAHALLFALPGTPVIRYGEEIGMGEDLSRPERLAVRAPMQWSNEANAGFSCADTPQLAAPLIDDGEFGYQQRNVYAQTLRDDSLLSRSGTMTRTRIGLREIAGGQHRAVEAGCPSVFAIGHDNDSTVLMLVNLADREVDIEIAERDLQDMVDVLADSDYDQPKGHPLRLRPNGYGYRWLRRKQQLFG
ncbi:alpha-amylase family protein [Stutzerimonas stutzeri]|uniref:alpha-amylase family protein n=1 Tax=Stutzerimonas stutzeri TaxID=316 RepID=UPI00210BD4D6|nr:alpha-amylase family protein [Stutzerimonas stutzeri]MCQ4319008.1 alpha-amylase family protein [Stutzerimonas stutzeri]